MQAASNGLKSAEHAKTSCLILGQLASVHLFFRLLVIECITNRHCVLYIGYALYIRTRELLEEIHSCYLFFMIHKLVYLLSM